MTSDLEYALQITLIGMSLVFAAIVLLWGLMVLLVRINPSPSKPVEDNRPEETISLPNTDLKYRAAAAAVAVALEQQRNRVNAPHLFPLPPTALVSAWQAVMRANQLRRGINR